MSQTFFSCKWRKLAQTSGGKQGIPWLLSLKILGDSWLDGGRFSVSDLRRSVTSLLSYLCVGFILKQAPHLGSWAHILPAWHPYRKWFSKVFKQKLWKFPLARSGSLVPPMFTHQGTGLSIMWPAWTRRFPKGNRDIDINSGGHGPWAGKCSEHPYVLFLWLRILFPITALCPVFLEDNSSTHRYQPPTRDLSLAHKWCSFGYPLLFRYHMNLRDISVLAVDCLSPCD